MLEKELLASILEETLKKGGDFTEIYVEEQQVNSIFCEDDKIEKINSGRELGAGIRVIKDGKTAYVYTNDLSAKGLHRAAQTAAAAARAGSNLSPGTINLMTKKVPEIRYKRLPETVAFEEKIEQVLAANHGARSVSEDIRQVSVSVGDIHNQVQIANSDNEYIEDERVRVRATVQAIASRNGVIQTGYESIGGSCGWELLDEIDFKELAKKAGELAVKMLSARPAPVGKMPVVLSAQAGGTMIHEACGHGLEADLVQKGLSVYRNKLGQKVANSQVTVIDDATIEGKYGSYRFDDEGHAGQRTVLIKNGELVQYMYDRLTAYKDNTVSTGNGRRESYQHKPIPRMSNTYIAPGSDDPADIVKSTQRGLMVNKMGGGQVNTTNGDFVFEVQEGYLIEDGEIKEPVRGASLTGNGPEVLTMIDRVGKDLDFSIGVCGKDGQGVPVSDAQPTIRIKNLTVGGTFADNKIRQHKIRRI
ncbi:MAG: TldD/PmbA family protein [Syntrophomonadaceae bacterium]|nr:TldD/PmbA family protein [Syntrophomonadaceae bacterium]